MGLRSAGSFRPDDDRNHPSRSIQKLLSNNRRWADLMAKEDPDFFAKSAEGQTPEYLWIGCSDSRVVTNFITGLEPGDIFTHRNVGNIVSHSDLNCMSAVEFAVSSLKVKHIIVCGHYGCGACAGALNLPMAAPGMVNSWISRIRDVKLEWSGELGQLQGDDKLSRLCELNAVSQTLHMCESAPVQGAWAAGEELHVHGMIYGLSDGALACLVGPISSPQQATEARQAFSTSRADAGA